MKNCWYRLVIPILLGLTLACSFTNPFSTQPPANHGNITITPAELQAIPPTPTPTTSPSSSPTPASTSTPELSPIINKTTINRLKEIGTLYQTNPGKLYWVDHSQYLAVQSPHQVVLYDTNTLVSIATFSVEEPYVILGFSVKEKLVAVTNDQVTIEIWDILTNEKQYSFHSPFMFLNAYFTSKGELAVDSIEEIAVSLLDPHTGDILQTFKGFQTAAPVYSTIFTKDNSKLIWISRGTIQLYDLQTKQLGPVISHEDFINSQALSPDGTLLVTSAGGTIDDSFQPLLYFWKTANGELINKMATDEMVWGLDFSAEGDILCGGAGKQIILWDSSNYTQLLNLSGFNDTVNYTSFSPDGRILAGTSFDNSIRLW